MSVDMNKDYSAAIADAKAKGQDTTQLEADRAEKISRSSDAQLSNWGVNRAGQSTKEASPPNGPSQLSQTEINTLKVQPGVKNDITLKDENGNSQHITGYVLNGHSYDSSGQRLFNYDENDTGGKYAYSDVVVKQWSPEDTPGYDSQAYVELKQKPVVEQDTCYRPTCYSPPPPPFISWNEAAPTFSSDLKKVNKYSYFFGLDNLTIKHAEINQNCCFISQDISLGEITADGYIQLEADYSVTENSSVEFYILDGGSEIPILPVGSKVVANEKIFCGLNTRFSVDSSDPITIKKDGFIIDATLEKAKESNDGLYTATYTTNDDISYKPINSTIKIKVIMRLYNKNTDAPYVKKIKIRKFGGGTLWKDTSVI